MFETEKLETSEEGLELMYKDLLETEARAGERGVEEEMGKERGEEEKDGEEGGKEGEEGGREDGGRGEEGREEERGEGREAQWLTMELTRIVLSLSLIGSLESMLVVSRRKSAGLESFGQLYPNLEK